MTEYREGAIHINAAWGSFGSDGRWYPNLNLPLTMQREQNIENGYICQRCEYERSKCVCANSSNRP